MAIGQRPHQINKTPAPKLTLKTGGFDYGEAQSPDTPSSLPPAVGGPMTKLGQNLRDSGLDDVMAQVLAKGTAGRDNSIPADEADDYQLRKVSADMYPVAGGGSMRRQQDPDKIFGKASSSLPSKETDNETEPVRKPV